MNGIHFEIENKELEELEDRRHQTSYYDEELMCFRTIDRCYKEEIDDLFMACKGYLKKLLLFSGSIAISFITQRILLSAACAVDFTKLNEFIPINGEVLDTTIIFDEKNFVPRYKTFDFRPKIKGVEIKQKQHLSNKVTSNKNSIQIMNYVLSQIGDKHRQTHVSSKVKLYPSLKEMIFQTNNRGIGIRFKPIIMNTIPRNGPSIGLMDRIVQLSGGAIPFLGALDALGLGGKIMGIVKQQLYSDREKERNKKIGLGKLGLGKSLNVGLNGLRLSSPIMLLLIVYNLIRTDRTFFHSPKNAIHLIIPQRKSAIQLFYGKVAGKPLKYIFILLVVLSLVVYRKEIILGILNPEKADHINSLVKEAFNTIQLQQSHIGKIYKDSISSASNWSNTFYKNNLEYGIKDTKTSAAKDVVINKQSVTINTLIADKHKLELFLNDASHTIGNCNREFYNFRQLPEITEAMAKGVSNPYSLDNPEYIYKEVGYSEKKKKIMDEVKSMIGGSVTDYLREPNYLFL